MDGFFSESVNGLSKKRKRDSDDEDERFVGYEEQKKLLERARKPYDQRATIFAMTNSRFKLLNNEEIRANFHAYDNDPHIQIAAKVHLNAALGGGVSVSDSFEADLDDDRKKSLQLWRSNMLVSHCESVYRHKQCLGFMPWLIIPNAYDVGEVRPLNMEEVMCMYEVSLISEPRYAFFEKPTLENGLGKEIFNGFVVGRPIPNVYVTTWQAPASNGRLRSVVSLLRQEKLFIADYQEAARRANRRLANPHIVTQMPNIQMSHGKGSYDENVLILNNTKDDKAGQQNTKDKLYSTVSATLQARGQLDDPAFESIQEDFMCRVRTAAREPEGIRVDLEAGRELVSQVLPQGPKDLVQNLILHAQLVYQVMEVPASMIQTESARGKIASGDDSHAGMLFRNSQMKLKQLLTNQVTLVYNTIHNPVKMEKYFVTLPLYEEIDDEKMKQAVNTAEVRMPGTPPEAELKELLLMGVLKPEAFVQYIARIHNIPIEDLYKKPQTSLTDIMTEGKETLQDEKLKSDEKKQSKELKQRDKDAKSQQDGMKTQMQLEQVKQDGMDGKIELEKVKQKGVEQKAKLQSKAKTKSKTKSKTKPKTRSKR